MKNGKPHRVPLSEPAINVILSQQRITDSVWVFPNSQDNPLSDTALAKVLKAYPDKTTIHGLRSTFRDWAGEASSHPREIIEMTLAHSTHSATEAAYARGDLLLKRRRLMEDWAGYLTTFRGDAEDLFAARDDQERWG